MLRKTSAAAAIVAFATVGSALFGGAALANGDGGDKGKGKPAPAPAPAAAFTGGEGGEGGDARTVCFVVGDHVFESKNTVGDPTAATSLTCSSAGGYGGAGGSGIAEY